LGKTGGLYIASVLGYECYLEGKAPGAVEKVSGITHTAPLAYEPEELTILVVRL